MTSHALLTVSIGPVQSFIVQARRVADQWSASRLLSKIVEEGIQVVLGSGGEMIFPHVDQPPFPRGLPNRFVCRVPLDQVETIATQVEARLRQAWADEVDKAARIWTEKPVEQVIGDNVSIEQAQKFLEVAWSWVPEEPSYAKAMIAGAQRFAASRMFRSFPQGEEMGEKCALCGERTALPNGRREDVRQAWLRAAENTKDTILERYFREGQGRLCLVCLTKRLYPVVANERHLDDFGAFDRIGMAQGDDDDRPYFALVSMDGDHIGRILGWGEKRIQGGKVREFQKALSTALNDFADSLRGEESSQLKTSRLGYDPETPAYLVYAGGEDVVFYCHPRDAFPLARAVHQAFRKRMEEDLAEQLEPENLNELTISAAILFAHSRRPAGLSFADVGRLLKLKAKQEAGRNAVALRLDKRSGRDVEVAFPWTGKPDHATNLTELSIALRDRRLASRTTYRFTDEERILGKVFKDDKDAGELWKKWLVRRLSVSGEVEESPVEPLAELLAPFLTAGHPEALRIARFLGCEVGLPETKDASAGQEAP